MSAPFRSAYCSISTFSTLATASLTLSSTPALVAAQPATTRVSVASGNIEANAASNGPAISADGRWVAFASSASNLVPGDTNNADDVFVHDRQTRTTTRVSVGPGGIQGNGVSHSPAISADGRYVAFVSIAGTLVDKDTNHALDIFVHDRVTGITMRVSVGPGDVQGDLDSRSPTISADGRFVAFDSIATNLVDDDSNGVSDAFVHDRQTGLTTRVSVASDGAQANGSSGSSSISADGRWVAFASGASNLVPDDTNGVGDVFVHDRQTGTTTRVSLGAGGLEGNRSSGVPSTSGDGRRVAFQSAATNLVPGDTNGQDDVFVHDVLTQTTTRASLGPGGVEYPQQAWSEFPAISADGRRVVFDSAAPLVQGDDNGFDDVFVYDIATKTLARASVGPMNVQGDQHSYSQAISADGRWVAFASWASNLVAGDTNQYGDIFIRDLLATTPVAPGDLSVYSVVGNTVTLRWTASAYGPAPTGFLIEGGQNPGDVLGSVPTGTAAPVFSFAAPAGSFFVRVHALNGTQRSAASNEIRIHVNVPLVPSAPAHLLAVVNGSAVTLAWQNTYGGGAPTSLVLDATGSTTVSLPLALGETAAFTNVPPGTYTLTLRAENGAGRSLPSNPVTLTVPGPCTGPPLPPTNVMAFQVDRIASIAWTPGASGPAPTAYVLIVSGSSVLSVVTAGRCLRAPAGPGTYTLSVVAVNPCGVSAGTAPQTLIVP
jgi:Tol biopolymer transport system component